jgi:hypothetical protein
MACRSGGRAWAGCLANWRILPRTLAGNWNLHALGEYHVVGRRAAWIAACRLAVRQHPRFAKRVPTTTAAQAPEWRMAWREDLNNSFQSVALGAACFGDAFASKGSRRPSTALSCLQDRARAKSATRRGASIKTSLALSSIPMTLLHRPRHLLVRGFRSAAPNGARPQPHERHSPPRNPYGANRADAQGVADGGSHPGGRT